MGSGAPTCPGLEGMSNGIPGLSRGARASPLLRWAHAAPYARAMVKKLLHTRMRVNDLERTVKFYEDVLGLKVGRRHTSPRGAQLAFIRTPNSDEEIELCQLPGSPPVEVQPDLMHLAFEVDDIAAFQARPQRRATSLATGRRAPAPARSSPSSTPRRDTRSS